jgi:hypothetical protein
VFPHLSSTDIPFSSYPLRAKYVELIGKDKGYNSSHVYCPVKGWSKRAMKPSQTILERVLKMVWWRGRKWAHVKRFWSWNVFLLSKYWLPNFICRDSWTFSFFLPLFFSILFIWNGMEWLSHDYGNGGVVDISVVDAYSGMELCTPIL